MRFAAPMPPWLAALFVVALVGVAFASYRRPLAPLSAAQRALLTALRASSLIGLLLFLLRPIILVPASEGDVVVPILLDVSRSMRVPDAGASAATPRLTAAVEMIEARLLPDLSQRFRPEVYAVGDLLEPIAPASLLGMRPQSRRSDLAAALTAVEDRYRGRRMSGIVLLSDGGETTASPDGRQTQGRATSPVFAIGVGSVDGLRDREVIGLAAGDPQLDQASVDVRVSAVSHGYGRQPFDLQIRANGRLLETRRVTPVVDGSPIDELFTVVPDPVVPTVLAVDVAIADGEAVPENNTRSILVSPPGRKRRILVVEGAPGFEHGFLVRALAQDPGLDVDAVVRKGKNESGRDTFLVQAGGDRAPLLMEGFPARKEDLFAYDAIIIANLEGDFFTQTQLTTMAKFVGERGGGLLVLGGRSFAQRGLIGTPLEDVLPVELNDRRGGISRAALGVDVSTPRNAVVMTLDGEPHSIMRIGPTLAESRKRWAAMPPLAAIASLGGPRPGASILGVAATPGGVYPVVAVQRYGRGRSMIFGGEAAWRWRMRLPSTDRSYEFFWRQSARWLAGPAPDPVTVRVPASAEPGDAIAAEIEVRDARFAPATDATVHATVTAADGVARVLAVRQEASGAGVFAADLGVGQAGLYRIHVEARRNGTLFGSADQWLHVGGGDREFADPRLNEGVLRRMAAGSGGRYVKAAEVASVVRALEAAVPHTADPEPRDVWHQPWAYALVVASLSAEWVLRRRWGLR